MSHGLKVLLPLLLAIFVLAGCDNVTPDNNPSHDGPVAMHYRGRAIAGEGDPINNCRVYVFKLSGYYQSAILCSGNPVATGSGSHQTSSQEDAAAANSSAVPGAIQ